jgi:hypothetical protein
VAYRLLDVLDPDELDDLWGHLGHDSDPAWEGLPAADKKDKIAGEFRRRFGHAVGNLARRIFDRDGFRWADIVKRLAEHAGINQVEGMSLVAIERALLDELEAECRAVPDAARLEIHHVAEKAADALAHRINKRSYLPIKRPWRRWRPDVLVAETISRPVIGPDYVEVAKAALFLLSAVDLHQQIVE